MVAVEVVAFLGQYWPLLVVAVLAAHLIANKYYNGLNKYPGPRLAAYTNWWRYFNVLGRKAERTHLELHRRHGDIVRLGPNVLSFADPRAIKSIYGLNKGMIKTDFCKHIPSCRCESWTTTNIQH